MNGKTTLLKMVNVLILPDHGTVLVNGKEIQSENLIALRRSIGYCIQGSILFPHMTVEENISYVPNLQKHRDKKKTQDAVKKWIQIVGLPDEMRSRYPSALSGAQQQRGGLARALVFYPDILLTDEPFGAIDEITRGQLQTEMLGNNTRRNLT